MRILFFRLQALSYYLCYVYARCTRSVSLVFFIVIFILFIITNIPCNYNFNWFNRYLQSITPILYAEEPDFTQKINIGATRNLVEKGLKEQHQLLV
jgi:hypothetical protein